MADNSLRAVLYSDASFGGSSQDLLVGTHRKSQIQVVTTPPVSSASVPLGRLGSRPPGASAKPWTPPQRVGDKAVSSLKVPAGWSVTLCEDAEGRVPIATFVADTAFVGEANDRTSSVVVLGPPPPVPDLSRDILPDDVYARSWADRDYHNVSLLRHDGTLLALAQDADGAIVYSMLTPDGVTDSAGWPDQPAMLDFPRELALVGFEGTDTIVLPVVRRNAAGPVPGEYVDPTEADVRRSTTARLTAAAPFQVVSDGAMLYVFRQSGACGGVQDVAGRQIPVEDGTLLVDRFLLVGERLQGVREVRFQRSRSKSRGANAKDSLGATDLDGVPFVEPTQVLRFVRGLAGNDVAVALTPTGVAGESRWQLVRRTADGAGIELLSTARARDGLFDTVGVQSWTCLRHPRTYAVGAGSCRAPVEKGSAATCGRDLVPLASRQDSAGAALRLTGARHVPLSAVTVPSTAFSVEVWVRPDLGVEGGSVLLSAPADGADGFELRLGQHGEIGIALVIAGARHEVTTHPVLSPKTWQHLAVVVDGSRLRVHVDGGLRAACDDLNGVPEGTLRIDTLGDPAGAALGDVDDVRIWDRARQGRDISVDRSSRLTGLEPGLVHYWRLDEGSGDSLADLASGGSDTIAAAEDGWIPSGAGIARSVGLTRSVVRFSGRRVTTAPAVTTYFEQETSPGGYSRQSKPQKMSGRLMVAVGVGAPDGYGSAVASLTLGIGLDGALTEVPSTVQLDSGAGVGGAQPSRREALDEVLSIERERAGIDQQLMVLRPQVAELEEDLRTLLKVLAPVVLPARPVHPRTLRDGLRSAVTKQELADYNRKVELWQAQVDRLNSTFTVPAGVAPSPRIAAPVQAYWAARTAGTDAAPSRTELETVQNRLQTSLSDKRVEISGLTGKLAAAAARVEVLRGLIGARRTAVLPLLAVDSRGLTLNGGYCAFFPTDVRPVLLDSATGRVGLYGRGPEGEVAFAQFETLTERPTASLPCEAGELVLSARSPGLVVVPGARVTVEVTGDGADACSVRLSLDGAGIALTETWAGLPRNATAVAAVLNGQAGAEDGPGYDVLRTVCDPPGADPALGSRLVSAALVSDVGDLLGCSTSLPVLPEDAAGAATLRHRTARWEAVRPEAALDLGAGDPVRLVDGLDPERMSRMRDLTVETWVKAVSGGAPAQLVSQSSATGSYRVGVVPALCGATPVGRAGAPVAFTVASGSLERSAGVAPFTVEAWVVPPTGGAAVSVLTGGATQALRTVRLGIIQGQVYAETDRAAAPGRQLSVPLPAPDPADVAAGRPAWVHLAMVHDGAALWIYCNGKAAGAVRVPAPVPRPTNWTFGDDGTESDLRVDEVRVWSRALSTREVTARMRTRPDSSLPDLLATVRFTPNEDGSAGALVNGVATKGRVGQGPAVLPAYRVVTQVGQQERETVDHVALSDWRHVAVSFAERSAVQLTGASARLEAVGDALSLTRDLTLQVDVRLAQNSGAGVLVGRGRPDQPGAGMPYRLSVTDDDRLHFEYVDDGGVLREKYSEGKVSRGIFTRLGVSRTVVAPTVKEGAIGGTWVKVPGYADIRFLVGGPSPEAATKIDDGTDARASSATTIVGQSLEQTLTEIRIWNTAWKDVAWPTRVEGHETGLVAWWRFDEGEGGTSIDTTGRLPISLRGGARWVPTVDPDGSALDMYVDGVAVATRVPSTRSAATTAVPGFTVGARATGSGPVERLPGQLEELRVWRTARTMEQIQDNLFRRLASESADLLGRWTFEPQAGGRFADQGPRGNDLTAPAPVTSISSAPLGGESPLLYDAMLELGTPKSTTTSTAVAVAEYADLQVDARGAVTGVFKRCYGMVRSGRLHLVTGFKVGDLTTEWVSQVQTAPQLVGYVEGAPPVPAENFSTADDADYSGTSTVSLSRASQTTYTYASGQEDGSTTSVESTTSGGASVEVETGALVIFTKVNKVEVMGGVTTSFEERQGWLSESTGSEGSTLGSVSELTLTRKVVDDDMRPEDVAPGFVPANTGLALVTSETMDVYALRLTGTGALVSYSMRPNPDIPRDWNILTFEIDPSYTKQGTLDGRRGTVTDDTYPNAVGSPESSYFKPVEAYRLQARIREDESRAKATFAQQSTAFAATKTGVGDLAKRNLVNTYVWTADGGTYAEEEQSLDSRSETTGGTYSRSQAEGMHFNLELFYGGVGIRGEVNALFGGYKERRETRTKESTSSFGLTVELDGERDLRETDADGRRGVHRREGAVDAYRFKTFYLEPSSSHYDTFFGQVVDQTWLSKGSPAARALLEAQQDKKRPACWRILHRVTYVSRHLGDPGDEPAATLEAAMRSADLSSNHELVSAIDPLVRDKRSTSAEFETAVAAAVSRYLPALVPYVPQVVSSLRTYYGDVGVPVKDPVATLSVWAGPDRSVTVGEEVALEGFVLDETTATVPKHTASWSMLTPPGATARAAAFGGTGGASTRVVLPEAGSYTFRLAAVPFSGGPVAWDDVTITAS